MLIRTKSVLITSGLLAVVILGMGLMLRAILARPSSAIATAQSFVDGLRANQLERAYQLTTRQGEVGRTLAEFQAVVRQQWPTTAPASVRFEGVRSFQSYGNRLHRWLRGQEADPPQLWLEFSVGGVPFHRARDTPGPEGVEGGPLREPRGLKSPPYTALLFCRPCPCAYYRSLLWPLWPLPLCWAAAFLWSTWTPRR